jgi:hypothetical protein
MKLRRNEIAKPQRRERPSRKTGKIFAPLGGALLVTGLIFLTPDNASPEEAQDRCTASTVKGKMKTFASRTKSDGAPKSVRLNIPSSRKGAYIQVALPDSYSSRLYEKASKLEGAAMSTFLRGKIGQNIERGVKALGAKKTASFDCVPLGEAASSTPPTVRRRTMDEPARKLPSLPKQVRRGKGTRTAPYVVVPKSGREKDGVGSTIIRVPIPFGVDGNTLHFDVRFTLSQLREDKVGATASEMKGIMRAATRRYAAEHGIKLSGKVDVNMLPSLRSLAGKVAQKNADYKTYLEPGQ